MTGGLDAFALGGEVVLDVPSAAGAPLDGCLGRQAAQYRRHRTLDSRLATVDSTFLQWDAPRAVAGLHGPPEDLSAPTPATPAPSTSTTRPDPVGSHVNQEPVQDFSALDARGVAEHAYHDPGRFSVDPAPFPAERVATVQGNMRALRRSSGGPAMSGPCLRERLASVTVPALVLWGESDLIATPAYGEHYAAAFPNARSELIPQAGHLPHLEQSPPTPSPASTPSRPSC
ncbi:alpha/beta fold hydrolase [Streptomyces sp. NPDC090106]|uniref:alpha/beta fold hydrolase n=1 Tax=Streptomyces sp. NPDC090106 TaxID=3365946 RepID=UPI00382731D7